MRYPNIKKELDKYNGSIKENDNHNYILSGCFNPEVVDFNGDILSYTVNNNKLDIIRDDGKIRWKLILSEEKMNYLEDLFSAGTNYNKKFHEEYNRHIHEKERKRKKRRTKKRMREVKYKINNG